MIPDFASADRAALVATLVALQQAFEELIVRGLESTGAAELQRLANLGDELARAGASYLADQLAALVHATREHGASAPRTLLRAQTATRVLERIVSLDAASDAFAAAAGAAPGSAPASVSAPASAPPSASAPASAMHAALVPILDEVAALMERLVASGLTAATVATQQKLDASFREVSRLKLLRLAAVLRYVHDEHGRFVADSAQFSARRLAFFLHRAWLLARGLARAITSHDTTATQRLLLQTPPQPVADLTVAVLGVQKRSLLDGSAAFEFRLRVLAGDLAPGMRLLWSCVFAARKGVPAEAFLHLPQPQKFAPKLLLEPVELQVTRAAVALDTPQSGRLLLGPSSTVKPGAPLGELPAPTWRPADALARIRAHAVSPLDLEVDLQEELVITDYTLAAPTDHPFRAEQQLATVSTATLTLDAVLPRGPEGLALHDALAELWAPRATRPPLYGLVHYEMGRLVFQPLTALAPEGPRHLMISRAPIDLAALMKTLDFTT